MISPDGSKNNKVIVSKNKCNKSKPQSINYSKNIISTNNNNEKPIQKVKSIDRDIFNPGSSPSNNSFMEKLNIRALTY